MLQPTIPECIGIALIGEFHLLLKLDVHCFIEFQLNFMDGLVFKDST